MTDQQTPADTARRLLGQPTRQEMIDALIEHFIESADTNDLQEMVMATMDGRYFTPYSQMSDTEICSEYEERIGPL